MIQVKGTNDKAIVLNEWQLENVLNQTTQSINMHFTGYPCFRSDVHTGPKTINQTHGHFPL